MSPRPPPGPGPVNPPRRPACGDSHGRSRPAGSPRRPRRRTPRHRPAPVHGRQPALNPVSRPGSPIPRGGRPAVGGAQARSDQPVRRARGSLLVLLATTRSVEHQLRRISGAVVSHQQVRSEVGSGPILVMGTTQADHGRQADGR